MHTASTYISQGLLHITLYGLICCPDKNCRNFLMSTLALAIASGGQELEFCFETSSGWRTSRFWNLKTN